MTSEDLLKRYKNYPPSHFSRWRYHYQAILRKFFIWPFIWFKYHPVVYGKENVLPEGPYILVSNHVSLLDPPMIACAINKSVAFMAKKELFQNRFMAEFFRSSGCFALDRDKPDSSTLKTALNVLKSPGKWVLGIFPEGTRSTTGEILPLKKGIGSMACKTGMPVLPVGIYKDKKGRLIVTIGAVIKDVSDPEAVHQKVQDALIYLADSSWKRKEKQDT